MKKIHIRMYSLFVKNSQLKDSLIWKFQTNNSSHFVLYIVSIYMIDFRW